MTLPLLLAAAGLCSDGRGIPIRAPLAPADLGVLPEACERTEASFEARTAILVDDLYGSVDLGAGLRGRLVVAARTWLSLWTPSLQYRYVANATVTADRVSLGNGALGIHRRLVLGNVAIAPFLRVLLPTETGFDRATRWGGELGIAVTAMLGERLEVVGGYTVTYLETASGGGSLELLSEAGSADVLWHRWDWLAFGLGLGTRLALADRRPFESLDPRLAVRLTPSSSFFANVSAVLPLLGRDRTDVGIGLSVGLAR